MSYSMKVQKEMLLTESLYWQNMKQHLSVAYTSHVYRVILTLWNFHGLNQFLSISRKIKMVSAKGVWSFTLSSSIEKIASQHRYTAVTLGNFHGLFSSANVRRIKTTAKKFDVRHYASSILIFCGGVDSSVSYNQSKQTTYNPLRPCSTCNVIWHR